jgi:hypothetical protein
MEEPVHQPDRHQNEDKDAERLMDRHQQMIIRQRRNHRDADEQHGKNQHCHRPVQDA